jgi:allantoin racemase
LINPNATGTMTEAAVAVARSATSADVEVLGWTNHDGPPAIQGPEDGMAAVSGILGLVPKARASAVDAIIIACFDDTGLAEVRAAAHCPVIGIGQAAFTVAELLGHRFSVVTTLAVSVAGIEANIAQYGYRSLCARVRPSGLPVLAVDAGSPQTIARLQDEVACAAAEDGITAAVLGCAGMGPLLDDLQPGTRLVLIDGIRAAAWLAPGLMRARAAQGAKAV